jgi:hypothetical protein
MPRERQYLAIGSTQAREMAMARSEGITFRSTHRFLNELFADDVHAKRLYSLANATLEGHAFAILGVCCLQDRFLFSTLLN